MEQSAFIKTTAFGGYDKTDVDNALELLYSKVFSLENELRKERALLAGYQQGKDENAVSEEVLAEDKKLLAEAQGKCKALEEKVERLNAEISLKDNAIDDLTAKLNSASEALENANRSLELAGLNNSEALSKVFIEAQKSADMLVNDSRKQAEDLKADSLKLTENMVIEANNKAAVIVYNAEKKAAETEACSRSAVEELKAASTNLKASMLSDIQNIGGIILTIKELLNSLETSGSELISRSEEVLKGAQDTLTAGGIPEFTRPEAVVAAVPEAPQLVEPDRSYITAPASDENVESDLDMLMNMAMSINDDIPEKSTPADADTDEGGDIDLDMLAKMAESI